ncbi:LacI family DNA-binding transcriptional regulator [Arthrobacter rhombi]|uniref:LacI family DNA-binding transcriptional regulator n=1 Tax=Arthrobacter rhombi TaxID=71253 RepID=UPI0031D9DB85
MQNTTRQPLERNSMTKPGPARDATVADVARRAGVSKAQAARALGAYGSVSEAVLTSVQAAAKELGYHPNHVAKSMNTGRSHTVGVVVGDIENPYFGRVVRGISDAVRERGYNVMLVNSDEQLAAEQEAVRALLDMRVDGLIVAPASAETSDHLRDAQARGRALVLFDRGAPGIEADLISVDFQAASAASTQQLIDAGHERIAYISSLRSTTPYAPGKDLGQSPVSQRIGGIEAALANAGLRLDPALVRLNAVDPAAVESAVDFLLTLAEPPTAFVASDNMIAQSLFGALIDRGLSVPGDCSFVMYDDFPWTLLTTPPLTVIRQPVYEMGVEAGRRIVDRIEGKTPGPMPDLEAAVISRGSIAPPRKLPPS